MARINAFITARHLSLSWARSIQSMTSSHFLNIHLNIILPSTPGFSKWSLSLSFTYPNPVWTHRLPHTCYMPRPCHSSRFDYLDNIWWGVKNTKNFCEYFRIGVRSSDRRQYSGPLLLKVANNHRVGRPLIYATESVTDQFWKWPWTDSKSDHSVHGHVVYAHTWSSYLNYLLISFISQTNTSIIVGCDKVYCGAYWQTSQWNILLPSPRYKLFGLKTGTQ